MTRVEINQYNQPTDLISSKKEYASTGKKKKERIMKGSERSAERGARRGETPRHEDSSSRRGNVGLSVILHYKLWRDDNKKNVGDKMNSLSFMNESLTFTCPHDRQGEYLQKNLSLRKHF